MNEEIDFTKDVKAGNVNRVTDKARELWKLEREIKEKERDLEDRKRLFTKISTEEIPTIMEEENIIVDELPFSNGYKLILKDVIAGSIPSESAIKKCKEEDVREQLIDRRQQCLTWLQENKAGSLIANVVIVSIPKSKDGETKAKKIMKLANELDLSASKEQSVHYQTLNSFLRELINKGEYPEEVLDIFEIFMGKKAIVKAPKK